ncbi:MAG: hypothetical protein Q4C65_02470 [Eubacteriales bacterium]|nr:hypothetical protein [Eubacteriales bacterium]
MDMNESILISIKKMLGIEENYTHFDPDIIMHINTAFMVLTQLGVGPAEGFTIQDDLATWSDFLAESVRLESVKSYILLRVKMLFDPPLSAAVMESMKQMISEFEWRLNLEVETTGEKGE